MTQEEIGEVVRYTQGIDDDLGEDGLGDDEGLITVIDGNDNEYH